MEINIENVVDTIKKNRPNLKDNSIKQYQTHLNKLKKLFETDNYDFLKNVDEVMDKLSDKHYTSQRNTLNAIIILLMALNSDNEFDELIEQYQKIRDSKNQQYIDENKDGNKISEKQKPNFAEMSEIQEMLRTMENEIKSKGLKKKENLTGKEKELLMVFTIYSFLINIPLRNDLAGTILTTRYSKLSEEEKKANNYLVSQKNSMKMILNNYKTNKTYGQKEISIPKHVEKILRMYIKATGKKSGDVLFVSSKDTPLSRNAMSQLLIKTSKKYLNKSISSTMIRKIVVSHELGDALKKQKELANVMGHDISTQNLVYNKEQ